MFVNIASGNSACPPVKCWQRLYMEVCRAVRAGQDPQDAAWEVVMAVTVDDEVLEDLWKSCPDLEACAYYEWESSGAEKQSLVLGNLHAILEL